MNCKLKPKEGDYLYGVVTIATWNTPKGAPPFYTYIVEIFYDPWDKMYGVREENMILASGNDVEYTKFLERMNNEES